MCARQTLSRLHVCAALAASQFLGAIVTMVARALSPDGTGPGHVFPDFALWSFHEGLRGMFGDLIGGAWTNGASASITISILGFLDRVDLSDHHYHRLLLVLPQGTTRSVTISFRSNHY